MHVTNSTPQKMEFLGLNIASENWQLADKPFLLGGPDSQCAIARERELLWKGAFLIGSDVNCLSDLFEN